MYINIDNWMNELPGGIEISEIDIPGTHDTCSFYGGDFVECQLMGLKEQLEAGIRFVDIRCKHKEDKFAIFHGNISQKQNFEEDVRNVCQEFLKLHPSECIIMSIKQEGKDAKCTRIFEETLDSYLNGHQIYWYLENRVPTLGEVRGKIVLLRRYEPSARLLGIDISPWEDNTTFWDKPGSAIDFYVQDNWKVFSNRDEKWDAIKNALNYANKRKSKEEIVLNFASGVGTLCEKRNALQELIPPTPHDVAEYVNKKLKDSLKKSISNLDRGYGIIIMDFPPVDLIQDIINLNKHKKFSTAFQSVSACICSPLLL